MVNKVKELIKNQNECNYVDYKEKQYSKEKKIDLIIDVQAMANSDYKGDKYIIIGVKDEPGKERVLVGIDEVKDSEIYESMIEPYIEPRIGLQFKVLDIDECKIGVFIISKNNNNRPYIIKKELKQKGKEIREGYCYIRNNSKNSPALRMDYDRFYNNRRIVKVVGYTSTIAIQPINNANEMGPYYCSFIDVAIFNKSNEMIIFDRGYLIIKDPNDNILCETRVVGTKKYMGADFQLEIKSREAYKGDIWIDFSSDDCIRLGVDEYGEAPFMYKCELILVDIEGNEYKTEKDFDCVIFARGEILHKVHRGVGYNRSNKLSRFFRGILTME